MDEGANVHTDPSALLPARTIGRRDPNQLRRVLIGTKADLARGAGDDGKSLRQVDYEEARNWAAERCMSYVEVSAKTGINIAAALLTMVSEIAEVACERG